MRWFHAAIVTVSLLSTGCASRYFVQIAEGYSSPTITEGIDVRARVFTASQLVDACREAVPVRRLEIVPERLDLTVGGVYTLGSLAVVAIRRDDLASTPVPIVLEAEETDPPVLELRSDNPDLQQARIRAVRPGDFRMRVRTTCLADPVEIVLHGRVAPVTP